MSEAKQLTSLQTLIKDLNNLAQILQIVEQVKPGDSLPVYLRDSLPLLPLMESHVAWLSDWGKVATLAKETLENAMKTKGPRTL